MRLLIATALVCSIFFMGIIPYWIPNRPEGLLFAIYFYVKPLFLMGFEVFLFGINIYVLEKKYGRTKEVGRIEEEVRKEDVGRTLLKPLNSSEILGFAINLCLVILGSLIPLFWLVYKRGDELKATYITMIFMYFISFILIIWPYNPFLKQRWFLLK